MRAVQRKSSNYILSWPCDKYKVGVCTDGWEYNKLYEVDGVYYKKIDPVKLFNKLVENNWNYAEPGILYWDRIEQYNLLSHDGNFKYAGINPCKPSMCRAC
jgi:ribonucleotide reductase alpha subunit